MEQEYENQAKLNGKDFFGLEYGSPMTDQKLKELVRKMNRLNYVLNEQMYGPLKNNSVVIVIQVNKSMN